MQNISFVGKIYGLESDGKKGKDGFKVKFRLSVRKRWVSDEDKKNGRTQTFVPCVAFGKTAELIDEYFQDGSIIGVRDLEYSTWESDSNGSKQYFHNFKVGGIDFIPTEDGGQGGGGSKSSSKSSGSSKRRRDEDEDEDDSRSSRRSRRSRDEDDEEDDRRSSKRSSRRSRDEDDEDDDVPF